MLVDDAMSKSAKCQLALKLVQKLVGNTKLVQHIQKHSINCEKNPQVNQTLSIRGMLTTDIVIINNFYFIFKLSELLFFHN